MHLLLLDVSAGIIVLKETVAFFLSVEKLFLLCNTPLKLKNVIRLNNWSK